MARRRYDPERRERIIEAACSSIAMNGVRGTTNRVVAAMCDVPLGSMTYHFTDTDELLFEAFGRYVQRVREAVERRIVPGLAPDEAIDAVVDLIHVDLQDEQVDSRIAYELYGMGMRNQRYWQLLIEMTDIGRQALREHFEEDVAEAINTYIEGASTHLTLGSAPRPPEHTRTVIRRLASGGWDEPISGRAR